MSDIKDLVFVDTTKYIVLPSDDLYDYGDTVWTTRNVSSEYVPCGLIDNKTLTSCIETTNMFSNLKIYDRTFFLDVDRNSELSLPIDIFFIDCYTGVGYEQLVYPLFLENTKNGVSVVYDVNYGISDKNKIDDTLFRLGTYSRYIGTIINDGQNQVDVTIHVFHDIDDYDKNKGVFDKERGQASCRYEIFLEIRNVYDSNVSYFRTSNILYNNKCRSSNNVTVFSVSDYTIDGITTTVEKINVDNNNKQCEITINRNNESVCYTIPIDTELKFN